MRFCLTFTFVSAVSADVRTLAEDHPDCLAMLKNLELIAIAQDKLGKAGRLVRQRTNSSDPSPEAARVTNIVEQVGDVWPLCTSIKYSQ